MLNHYDDYGDLIENMAYEVDNDMPDDWSTPHVLDSLTACISPSLAQIRNYVLVLVGMSALCKVSWHLLKLLPTSRHLIMQLQHGLATFCGLIAIYAILEFDIIISLFFAIVSYALLLVLAYVKRFRIGNSYAGTLGILLIGTHIVYEMFNTNADMWQRLRGIQMVSMMKTISLAYDMESQPLTNSSEVKVTKNKSAPEPLAYFGYIFSPASCVLGPWISYADYTRSLHTKAFSLSNGIKCLLNISLAISFLLISNCVVPLIGDQAHLDHWIWLRAYLDALSVRTSHYFICFLSQATLLAGGHTQSENYNVLLGPLVVRPWEIEWPRSISALVRSWNIPMHSWLKMYVFKPWHVPGSYVLPIIVTYVVSALLHGLHLRIYMVLLSLAVFSFVEKVLRSKLANIFNACIDTNLCKGKNCTFMHCARRYGWCHLATWCILLVNLAFRGLAILHLAYLGIMLHSSEADGNLNSTEDVWQKWSQLNYLSHWLAAGTFLFYYVI